MQKSEGVVIPMQQNLNDITWLYPDLGGEPEQMRMISPLEPFCQEALGVLNDLSGILMRNPLTRTLPDVATFAFFCRKANLLKLKERFIGHDIRLGRGLVFHIAPSNVPVNFAYSLVCGVLSGNANIVRVPSKDFKQVKIISDAIAQVLAKEENKMYRSRIGLVKYERGSSATDFFSARCDVRVIWGGDQTIANIRQSSIPARAFDITFADRFSICAIDAEKYLESGNVEQLAEGFYNDTYLFDQNACSAPHLVVWRGSEKIVSNAKRVFWEALYNYTKERYQLADVLAVDKLAHFYSQCLSMEIRHVPAKDNLLWRVEADALPVDIDNYRCKAGYFTEFMVNDLQEIVHIINRKYQTLAYYGFMPEELNDFILKSGILGVDRVVPIGKTTDFDLVWDGYNLINSLTREITII